MMLMEFPSMSLLVARQQVEDLGLFRTTVGCFLTTKDVNLGCCWLRELFV